MIIFIVVFSEMRLMFICFSFSFSVLCKSAAEQVYVRFETNFVFLWRLFCLTITHGFLFGPKCPNDICFVILFLFLPRLVVFNRWAFTRAAAQKKKTQVFGERSMQIPMLCLAHSAYTRRAEMLQGRKGPVGPMHGQLAIKQITCLATDSLPLRGA